MILMLILSRIFLLILPISDLVGLISRQVGLLAKFGLWSFCRTMGYFVRCMLTVYINIFRALLLPIEHCSMEKSKHRLSIEYRSMCNRNIDQ